MPVKFTFSNPLMRTWLLIHQCHNLLSRSENSVFAKVGLTTRKHAVLLALKHLPEPTTVTDVARWLDRNANGISMLVDRMVDDGLVKRVRDMPDRRSVRLEATQKAKKAIEEADKLVWHVFQDLFGGIPDKDLREMSRFLEKVRIKALGFLKLEYSAEEMEILGDKVNRMSRIARSSLEAENPDDDNSG